LVVLAVNCRQRKRSANVVTDLAGGRQTAIKHVTKMHLSLFLAIAGWLSVVTSAFNARQQKEPRLTHARQRGFVKEKMTITMLVLL